MLADQHFPSFILHSRPWHESSVLLDVFSRDHGVVKIVARGAKSQRKVSWSAHLQLFVPLLLRCRMKGDWWQLHDVDVAGTAFELRDESHLCGLYCNELILRLLQIHDPHPEVFQLYLTCLAALTVRDDNSSALRAFEWGLLNALGYGIDLHYDHVGDGVDAEAFYRYHEHGLWPVAQATEYDFSGHDILYLADQQWTKATNAAKRLLRVMLQPHLGAEELQTRELWRQYEALKRLAQE